MPATLSVLSIETTLANGPGRMGEQRPKDATSPGVVHPSLIHDETHAILVDTGIPGMAELIAAAMEAEGVPLSRLTHVVLTHADMDHVGSLAQLLKLCPQPVQVLCHEAERPYVECDLLPLRLEQMEEGLKNLSGERLQQMTALAKNLRANYRNLRVEVTKTIEDGEMLPCGAQVIATPGHTPGHICLYLQDSKTLITGDALNVTDSVLMPGPDRLAFDLAVQKASLKKLAALDVETAVCFHGGEFKLDVNQRIKELAGI